MEALGVTASAAGLISLGLTVCNSLLAYYKLLEKCRKRCSETA